MCLNIFFGEGEISRMIILKNRQFLNRNEAQTDIEDRGYTFGDGVYEVIRIYNGTYFMLEEHLSRLQFSLRETGIQFDVVKEKIEEKLIELMKRNDIHDGAIYLQVTRGIAPRKHPYPAEAVPQLYAYPIPVSKPTEAQENGVSLTLVEDLRWLRCDIKSLNLLYNVMAKQKAQEKGFFEALLYRNEKQITEGSSTNFFGVKDGKIITHPANNYILNGITRIAVKRLCEKHGIPFEESTISIADIADLDEAFIASTTADVVPVVKVDEQTIGSGNVGPVVRSLQEKFEELLK
jgi:D-alanine transaminase